MHLGFVEFVHRCCGIFPEGEFVKVGEVHVDGNCASLLQEVGSWGCVDFVEV